VEGIIRRFARRESELFGEVLAPTIGTAVKKAVVDAIAAMMQKFNEALERSLSFRSIGWRLEARRTGKAFAEVVFLHTMAFHVEEAFLIHPASGLLLAHVTDPRLGVGDPDQVVAMLEAIDSFVRDAFRASSPDDHLSQIQFSDRVVWVDRSDALAVAALVRGTAPREFGALLRETRERLAITHGVDLAHFTSDVTPFAAARPELEQTLRSERHPVPARAHYWLAAVGVIALCAFAALGVSSARHQSIVHASARALAATPGFVVTSSSWSGRAVHIEGLRDPLADDPHDVLAQHDIPVARDALRLQPFYSLDPTIVLRRAQHELHPPPQVTLSLHDDVLRAAGLAPRAWIDDARARSTAIAGVESVDTRELRSAEDVYAFGEAIGAFESIELRFAPGSSHVDATAIAGAADAALRVVDAGARARLPACAVVTGFADAYGEPADNMRLSEARAHEVASQLGARGVPSAQLRAVAGGTAEARRVTFRVVEECPP
jgi:OOP family OmpA-OmpF porin